MSDYCKECGNTICDCKEIVAENERVEKTIASAQQAIDKLKNFKKELASLINKYSFENQSNTPDFILAEYLTNQLLGFAITVNNREKWHGRSKEDTGKL